MHVTLFEDTLKNAKVGKRPKRGTKSYNFGASFFDRFLKPRRPKMALSLFVVVVVVFVVVAVVVVVVVVAAFVVVVVVVVPILLINSLHLLLNSFALSILLINSLHL